MPSRLGLRPDNPANGIRLPNLKTDGYHAWTEAEIEQFQERHALGTKARLALALLLYTGQRRGDVVRLGRQHIRDGFVHMRQQKTSIELALPIHPKLAAIIAETPAEHLTLLTTQTGKPFSAAGFGNWFRDRCNEAELGHCSAHGLRKAAARRLAEAGCTHARDRRDHGSCQLERSAAIHKGCRPKTARIVSDGKG